MQHTYHRRPLSTTHCPRGAFETLPPPRCSPWPTEFRRTWKIVRSEIALDIEPPTSNDGACTIMSLPASDQPAATTGQYTLAPHEIACVAWLDWRGHHAKFSCVYNAFTDRYYRFYIDRASVDPPVRCWCVDIRFNQGVKFAGWRVRDDNGEWYMVMNIDLDEGRGFRRGKAYGKFMGSGVREEDVVMTAEEGAKLGCFVGRRTIEEQREVVERAKQMIKLEGALLQIRKRIKILDNDVRKIEEEEIDERQACKVKKEAEGQEEIILKVEGPNEKVTDGEARKRSRDGSSEDRRIEFHFPSPNKVRKLESKFRSL